MYTKEDLSSFGVNIMLEAGLDKRQSEVFVDNLIMAEMRGISSHGMTRLRTYAKRIKSGVVSATAQPEILQSSDSFLLVDGKNAMGSTIGIFTMDECIKNAKKHGACFASVKNANHFGIAAYYTMHAADKKMIAVASSNAPASIVPTGGKVPKIGTNPLSIAIPAGKYPPLVLDMASSVVAQGKVILAEKEGKSIPNTWAVDKEGLPTTSPNDALNGAMLPFGGPKGYAIAFIIDIMCSALSGAYDSNHINNFWRDFENPQNLGLFMGVFDIGKIMSIEIFNQRMDSMIEEIKSCPPSPGNESVYIPGEIENIKYQKADDKGIELGDAVIEDLIGLASDYSISHPF